MTCLKRFLSVPFIVFTLILSPYVEANHSTDRVEYCKDCANGVIKFHFFSEILESRQKIDIYLPKDYDLGANNVRYPVIYTLDGWTLSELVGGVVRHLSQTASMPEAIVVSIDQNYVKGITPQLYSSDSGWAENPKEKAFWSDDNGADHYLSFLKDELIPFINERYRTNHFKTLVSMSPTASFAMHSLISQPELFNAHFMFAATDVIGMGYTPEKTLIDSLVETLNKRPKHEGFLYVASSMREAKKHPAQHKNIEALTDALKTFKNFKVKAEHIENYGHYPMAVTGLLSALDLVFPRAKFDSSTILNHMRENPENGTVTQQLMQHYKVLSDYVGFEVRPYSNLTRNANSLRSVTRMLRKEGRFDEAIELGKLWVKQQPKSAYAHYKLSESYIAAGSYKAAKKQNSIGLDIAKANKDPNMAHYINQKVNIEKLLSAPAQAKNNE
ncbi:alpha/beta hydrolase-fold protein [Pseudoalteromonas umbrosa]|uniref:alpha/beta hydrolase-fold protein n=1 Tax=Pseudoalteromonas umbrosa TaxID=3048489 RepID=UPI0024C41447|nr:alpha/beta hydrolase-fold protein [Pseudoalteromonas sp. B95]MDK1289838.1 alpha/beta hydrolase-fold protein [Pseudoalteromonas sp. B95]